MKAKLKSVRDCLRNFSQINIWAHTLHINYSPYSGVQSEGTSELNQLQIVSSATNPLHIELGALSDELKDPEKALNQTGSVPMAPGLIKETQFCNFAGQIANGLAYLANMNVSYMHIWHTLFATGII